MVTKVKEMMITDVVTIDGSGTLMEALELMLARKVKSAVVPPRHDHDPYAIVTFTDIARKVLAEDEQISMLNVFDVMSRPAYSAEAEWDIRYAASMMLRLGVSRLIVTQGGKLAGIVSLSDLVRSVAGIAKS
ncbi:MAG: CBS domain-containing protein [Nitrospinota bacterium]|nr:CBS domain-containing protein [Nitrospinota bacterium]MDH5678659.1 CBS domain-containing protein [Nitrospinota bacterium]MDH5757030.1 CBS domain-containing protein [Nitrospinota bacterium]